ncbi:MAG: hypothetical protein HQM09_06225 [Candidatus Riflebacteria bacterium]|nr:hypothetical protein [Candidatus Riflebacteria bacterium]
MKYPKQTVGLFVIFFCLVIVIGNADPASSESISDTLKPSSDSAQVFSVGYASSTSIQNALKPHIIKLEPANGADLVDPSIRELKVTFDKPMTKGFSWCRGLGLYPETIHSRGLDQSESMQPARWTKDKKTCILPVKLWPNRKYQLYLNLREHQGFQSMEGYVLDSTEYSFTTKSIATEENKPHVIKFEPENKAVFVDPSISELKVTFDRPMCNGYSWCRGLDEYPETGPTTWTADHRTCIVSVKLRPSQEYQLYLNLREYEGFQSKEGSPLDSTEYRFTTKSVASQTDFKDNLR